MEKNIFKKIVRLLYDKKYRINVLGMLGFYDRVEDKILIKKIFDSRMTYPLDLNNPKTFNEKLQWLKLYNRNPYYTKLVDKYEVKNIVSSTIGEEYVIPTLGVWDKFDDIDFSILPKQFVLKCTHDSGGLVICKDKNSLDIKKAKKKIEKSLKNDYYLRIGREWPYKNVPRKIICEKYMTDGTNDELTDYKFFCFDGKVDLLMLCKERESGNTKFYLFDRKWNFLRYFKSNENLPSDFTVEKPENIDEMFKIAEKLSKDLPFVRIDLYNSNGKVYFGEYTFYPSSGFDNDFLKEADLKMGEMLSLPNKIVE